MNNANDMATWWPPIGADLDAAMSGAEDVLADLSDPAVDLDSPGATDRWRRAATFVASPMTV
jgi:hypothetical protein